MKLLFDQNISYRITQKLKDYFPGCSHVSESKLNDCEDLEVWKFARENDFVIVTFDADFYDISMINGYPPRIIWIRTGNLSTDEIVQIMIDNRISISAFIEGVEFEGIACLEIE